MARFRDISLGTQARRPVDLTLQNGQTVAVDLRVLNVDEEVAALAGARRYAVERGLPDPKEGDPIYDLGVMAHVMLLAAVDHDSPVDKPVPFFDDAKQAAELDRDRLQLLYEAQQVWQEECSPRRLKMEVGEYAALVFRLAGEEEEGGGDAADPFLRRLPRATLVSCMRTMARQLLGSPQPRSLSSSSDAPDGASEASADEVP